jgi:hypothetical protein
LLKNGKRSETSQQFGASADVDMIVETARVPLVATARTFRSVMPGNARACAVIS